ncbi:MAG TPA: PfkB family carbohydrate kinase [Hyphomicrobiaceae bacterium]|nr:PfkB family carbohydrate kinase [Hyphomicrobiaceae bacterium]
MGRILAISSHVVRGHVGLAATVPALQHLGHEVWALPSVILASRPGLGQLVRYALPAVDLAALLAGLEGDGCWAELDAVFTGYFPSPQSVAAAAAAIGRVRQAKPAVTVCVDPILGDEGRLYVAADTAAAIRDELLPLATLTTPNLFELAWLTTGGTVSSKDVPAAARQLAVPIVAVTSAELTPTEIATVLFTPSGATLRTTPRRAAIPNGAGDLFAGLLLGHLLNGEAAEDALANSLGALDIVLAASEHRQTLELAALRALPA